MQSTIQCPKKPSALETTGLQAQLRMTSGRRYSGSSKRSAESCAQSAMKSDPKMAFMACRRGV